jgi:hypoxanthine phosphoribosyltransferase
MKATCTQLLICGPSHSVNRWQATKKRAIEFEVLTWNRTYDVLLGLTRKIVDTGFVPNVIVGVSRGGWIPARVLCDLLSSPVLANIGVEFYQGVGKTRRRPRLTQPLSTEVSRRKVLVVDEIADTGKTLKLAKDHIIKAGAEEVRTVTLYTKPWSAIQPDYYGKKTSRWIVFPWETRETIRSIAKGSKWENKKELNNIERARLSAKETQRFLNEVLEEKSRTNRLNRSSR